jgi:small subunit ribosomal protein S27Ae
MAKKKKKKSPRIKKSAKYEVKDGLKRKSRFCPKCGPGIFMAKHKGREYCGKCSYTEWTSKGEQK